MTFFFFVIGLEARREFDLGELRERRRVAPAAPCRSSAGWSCPSRSTWRSMPATARPWLGSGDVDRHRIRARPARARRHRAAEPPARLPAHRRGRRRHRGAPRDRDRIQQLDLGGRAHGRDRPVRVHPRDSRLRHPFRAGLLRDGHGGLGRVLQVRRRSGCGRPDGWPDRARISGPEERPRARDRLLPALPRATNRRPRPLGARRAEDGRLAERAAAEPLASLDELRDCPALRARQRRRPPERRLSRDRLHLPRDAGDSARLRDRQAGRDRRVRPGWPRASAAAAFARRSAGRPSAPRARSPGSASPSPSSSRISPSTVPSSTRRRSASSARRCSLRR